MMEFVKNNVFSIGSLVTAYIIAYTTFSVNNAMMLRDIEEMGKDIFAAVDKLSINNDRIVSLDKQVAILEVRVIKIESGG
jgi:hypothetical protein